MNVKNEIILSFANRLFPPLGMFVAFWFLQQELTVQNYEKFLLDYSAMMWVVTSLFQWQKNTATKLAIDSKFQYFTVFTRMLIATAVIAFIIFFIYSKDFLNGVVLAVVTVSFGALYLVSAILRVFNYKREFLLLDSINNIFKWLLGIFLIYFIADLSLFFLTLGIVSAIVALKMFYIYKDEMKENIKNKPTGNLRDYKNVAISFVLMDLSIATYIYLDRFLQEGYDNSIYILSSTFSVQAVAIIGGAISMVVYPTLIRSFKDERQKFIFYWNRVLTAAPFFVLIAIPITLLIPYVLHFFFDALLVKELFSITAILAICHCLYFSFLFVSLPLIAIGKHRIVAVLFLVFSVLYFIGGSAVPEFVPLIKMLTLIILFIVTIMLSISKHKQYKLR